MVKADVAIVGGGRMGQGIVHAFLLTGVKVLLIEVSQSAASAAESEVRQSLVKGSERAAALGQNHILEVEQIIARLSVSTNISDVAESKLIIEAVPEDFSLKEQVLAEIDAAISSTALLASNTSSFSIRDLGLARRYQENFLGLHFFNPVPASLMVEIVYTPENPIKVIDAAATWVEKIGKTALRIADSPGFASSRLGLILGLEAMRMFEEGVATAEDIDTAMMLGYKHPVGPLKLTDIVGLDVRLGIAQYLEKNLGARFSPPKVLIDLVAAGNLGRKSGKGFYEWGSDGK
jgi:3-hydroxybutyryl-CoA dehydrogenase